MFAVTCLVSSSLAPRDDIVVDEEMLVVFWVARSASNEGYPKVRNHGEGLLLVENGYYRFHIYDTIKTLC